MLSIEDIYQARNDRNVFIIRNAVSNTLDWSDVSQIYDEAEDSDMLHVSFASMNIYNSEKYTDKMNKVIDRVSEVYGGKKIAMMLIIHPTNRNSNHLEDPNGISFKEKFIKNSPHPQPIVPIPYDDFAPTIHSDAVDGFFIQNDGETLWRIFRNTGVEQHVLKSGDMMYIPKNIIHSVESLTPRHSVSIAFEDSQSNACSRCGHQNN